MRKTLTSFIALAAVLALAACGDPAPKPSPETYKPTDASTVMPVDAPPQEEAGSQEAGSDDEGVQTAASDAEATSACAAALGSAKAAALVRRCIAVSPATHPPCNVANPCEMIQGEIDRSCAMYGPDETKPAECAG